MNAQRRSVSRRQQAERAFPHKVDIAVPPFGLGERLVALFLVRAFVLALLTGHRPRRLDQVPAAVPVAAGYPHRSDSPLVAGPEHLVQL